MEVERVKKEFLEAYDTYADALFRHCFLRVSDREQAIDITQETFLRVWQYIEKGNKVGNMRSFLYTILSNQIIDYYRKKKSSSLDAIHEKGFEIESGRYGASQIFKETETQHLLSKLHTLNDNYREILILRYVDGLSILEISEILGKKENSVSVQINRATEQLKKKLRL